jgi:excinuclease ABC subunit A
VRFADYAPSTEQIVASVTELPEGERVMILAPLVRGRKANLKRNWKTAQRRIHSRARLTALRALDEDIKLDKRKNHTIEVVVDRILLKKA